MPIPRVLGVEFKYVSMWVGPDQYLHIYVTLTNAAGRFAVRTVNEGAPCRVLIYRGNTIDMQPVVPTGMWPGPTATDRQGAGNRLWSEGFSVALDTNG